MPSSWGTKLEKKLNALSDGASKDSVQTLAKWVGFNRKHAAAFGETFARSLVATTTESRQWLLWQVLNEVLMNQRSDSEKWEKSTDLRATMGEAIMTAIEGLGRRTLSDKIEGLLQPWDDHNVFGGPSLLGQIRRQLTKARDTAAAGSSSSEGAAAPSSEPASPAIAPAADATPAHPPETKAESNKSAKAAETTAAATVETTTTTAAKGTDTPPGPRRSSVSSIGSSGRRGSVSSIVTLADYDFESKNVPEGKVESREFLDPCKAVATLQIARDVRNDAPVQLNGMLTGLPEDIRSTIEATVGAPKEKVEAVLDEATVKDYSIRIPSKLLELDLDEQLQTIRTFQDIIRQQGTAREQLIRLLLRSRCRFGSREAAEEFYALKETSQKLKRRKQFLADALELEGLDNELDPTDHEAALKGLPPLAWYDKDIAGQSPSKKPRVD